ncbi:MAG: peptidoglycan DD-metalloendopeptidase family protein [Deltaproteobacteria bacterium]|uniref:Peptidoglycan DD-metalloendopeptidase family protein n=1 Tax=Candidatus Zymogenus saltonus TaxID=2844893 RepID=A0A9D8PQE0_9DELT|nr:peptidoglycan DD-metalloendopeptidase family protein [Candidatus Zymogenus saltonus]
MVVSEKKRHLFLFAIIFSAGLLLSPGFGAADSIGKKKGELTEIEKKIKEKKGEINKTKKKEKSIIGEISRMDRELKKNEKEISYIGYKIDNTTSSIEDLEAKKARLEENMGKMQAVIGDRLVAFYKLGGAGYLPALFSAEDYSDVKRRGKYLSKVIEADRRLFFVYKSNADAHAETIDSLKKKRGELALLKEDVVIKEVKLKKGKEEKNKYLDNVRKEKSSYESALEELERSKKRLTALIERLNREREARERKKGISHAHSSPGAGGYFANLKGRLPYPVNGRVVTSYGKGKDPKYENPIFNKGIEIEAPEGVKFISVAKGEVIYADYFPGYGNLIIVDHGDSYYTVYGHAKSLYKGVGAKVAAGEAIGSVGDTGSLKGACLYFEIRHHTQTTNPSGWLVKK